MERGEPVVIHKGRITGIIAVRIPSLAAGHGGRQRSRIHFMYPAINQVDVHGKGCFRLQRADLAQRMAEATPHVVLDLSGVNFPPTRCQPSRATTESPKESLGAPNFARGRRLIAVEFLALAHVPSLEAPENDHTEAGARVTARVMSVLCDRGKSDALLSLSPQMRESG
ncbi:hypothetical protein MY4038_009324 [Beauveria bassiana]